MIRSFVRIARIGALAQPGRALARHARGQKFESSTPHRKGPCSQGPFSFRRDLAAARNCRLVRGLSAGHLLFSASDPGLDADGVLVKILKPVAEALFEALEEMAVSGSRRHLTGNRCHSGRPGNIHTSMV